MTKRPAATYGTSSFVLPKTSESVCSHFSFFRRFLWDIRPAAACCGSFFVLPQTPAFVCCQFSIIFASCGTSFCILPASSAVFFVPFRISTTAAQSKSEDFEIQQCPSDEKFDHGKTRILTYIFCGCRSHFCLQTKCTHSMRHACSSFALSRMWKKGSHTPQNQTQWFEKWRRRGWVIICSLCCNCFCIWQGRMSSTSQQRPGTKLAFQFLLSISVSETSNFLYVFLIVRLLRQVRSFHAFWFLISSISPGIRERYQCPNLGQNRNCAICGDFIVAGSAWLLDDCLLLSVSWVVVFAEGAIFGFEQATQTTSEADGCKSKPYFLTFFCWNRVLVSTCLHLCKSMWFAKLAPCWFDDRVYPSDLVWCRNDEKTTITHAFLFPQISWFLLRIVEDNLNQTSISTGREFANSSFVINSIRGVTTCVRSSHCPASISDLHLLHSLQWGSSNYAANGIYGAALSGSRWDRPGQIHLVRTFQ